MATDFTLPELGEDVTAGDVLRVLVKVGDTIQKDQPVLELETDKATIEVPSSVAGSIVAVNVKAGDKIKVGQTILSVDSGDEAASGEAAAPESPKIASAPTRPSEAQPAAPREEQRSEPEQKSEPEQRSEPEQKSESDGKSAPVRKSERERRAEPERSERDRKVVDIASAARPAPAPQVPPPMSRSVAPAAPSVRRMARELGVDINQVAGSGPDRRISIDDVKAHARALITGGGAAPLPAFREALPDFSRWGEIERQPMRAVRRKTADHLSAAWAAIPHVTQHDFADITELEQLRKKYAQRAQDAGGNLTVTAIAVKVVAAALKIFPQLNASIDMAADEIVYKKYIHIGIAVDTDRGLLVPVIRNADTKDILQLSVELTELSEKARSRKLTAEEMQGGCFSISNLGGIGGSFFTPIVNLPEVAILGISRARMEPTWVKATEEFVPRLMLPLSLSYDHRAVDGADGIRFLRWVVEALEQPFLLALEG